MAELLTSDELERSKHYCMFCVLQRKRNGWCGGCPIWRPRGVIECTWTVTLTSVTQSHH